MTVFTTSPVVPLAKLLGSSRGTPVNPPWLPKAAYIATATTTITTMTRREDDYAGPVGPHPSSHSRRLRVVLDCPEARRVRGPPCNPPSLSSCGGIRNTWPRLRRPQRGTLSGHPK